MENKLALRGPTEITTFDELMHRSEMLAKSGLIPASLRGKPADIAIILQIGLELGIAPMQSINGIDVVQGKPCVSPQLALALIYAKVPNAYIDFDCSDVSATVTMGRDKKEESGRYTTTWTLERAKRLGLAGKDNYIKQPGTMLKWRAVGDAARTVFPDVLKGFYFDVEIEERVVGQSDRINEIQAQLDANTKEVKPRVRRKKQEVEALPPVQEPAQEIKEPSVSEETPSGVVEFMQTLNDLDKEEVKDSRDPGDFEITFGSQLKGKKLRELSPSILSAYVGQVKSALAKAGKEPELQHLNFYAAADEFLKLS